MLKNRYFSFAGLIFLALALALSACTRSADEGAALPTTAPEGIGGGGEGVDVGVTQTFVANMSSTLSVGQTQTVVAGTGGGAVGSVATATPTSLIPAVTNTTVAQLATATPVPTGPRQYTVKPGDWLYKIARENGVSYRDIIAANPGIDPNFLQPGQVITIPGAGTGGGEGGKTYVVKPGDNLFRIALNNGTTYQILAQLNVIPAPYTVYPGQVIKLP